MEGHGVGTSPSPKMSCRSCQGGCRHLPGNTALGGGGGGQKSLKLEQIIFFIYPEGFDAVRM